MESNEKEKTTKDSGKKKKVKAGGKLVIVESPAKAKTIKKILGRGYAVKASVGHIRDLDSKGSGEASFGVDVSNNFEPRYVIIPGKKKTVDELKEAADKAESVYLAPDPDREGEAIAWHLMEALELNEEKAKRITYHSVTKKAVTEALNNPRDIDTRLVGAQKGRRVLDRIVGFSLSPFLWKKVAKKLSAGRVQSVAVRLIVEKERDIMAFNPQEFWRIDADLHSKEGDKTPFKASLVSWKGEKFSLGGKFSSSEKEVREVETALKNSDFKISDIKGKETQSKPSAPFITSTLQQTASSQLRYGARRTMQIAQRLYEGVETEEGMVGLITYMRTDSSRLDPESLDEIRGWIKELYSENLPDEPRLYGPKPKREVKAQDAHEAIRPTSVYRTPSSLKKYLPEDQFKLYELIWNRTVASQMKDARFKVTTLCVEASEGLLEAKGRIVLFKGFTVLVPEGKKIKEDYQELPSLNSGEDIVLKNLQTEQHWTKPPPRYSEASLVRELEKAGIGRPSTYASIVQTIRDRGYVRLEKRSFHANELGIAVNDILLSEFPKIMDYKFTAEMEGKLDSVEEGTIDWHHLLKDFYSEFSPRVEEAIKNAQPLKGRAWEGKERCPMCEESLIYRYSKSGAFLGCSNYPECKGLVPLPGEGQDDGETDGEPVFCKKCKKQMLLKSSRYGKFYACSSYPDCTETASLGMDGKPVFLPDIEMDCDECGTPMVMKSKKRGPVLVCPNTECKRELPVKDGVISQLPKANGVKCEKCENPMIVRLSRRGPFLACTGFPKCRNAKNIEKDGEISGDKSEEK